jgi:hypothetical protein
MKKTTRATYKKDKYYEKVRAAVDQLLQDGSVVIPAERLAGVDCDVRLIHLNHSNLLHRLGPERDWLAAQGIGVGVFGARWSLG